MYACSFLFPQRLARLASGCYLAVHRVHQRRSAGTHAHAAVHGCRDGELVCDSEGLVLSATPSAADVLPFLSPRSVVMRDDKLETLAPSLCREKCNGHGYCMRYWADDKALPFCNCLRDFEVGGGGNGQQRRCFILRASAHRRRLTDIAKKRFTSCCPLLLVYP